jgi:hypothetical protein
MNMREITIKIGQEVKVNGEVYPVLLDEVEILEAAESIQAEASKIEQTPAGIRAFGLKLTEFLDKVLGQGAVAKIAGGRKVGIVTLLSLVSHITADISKSYADTLAEYAPRK